MEQVKEDEGSTFVLHQKHPLPPTPIAVRNLWQPYFLLEHLSTRADPEFFEGGRGVSVGLSPYEGSGRGGGPGGHATPGNAEKCKS